MDLTILYRGPLSSCNYDCGYCPFAKHYETRAEHQRDAEALERFLSWAEAWDGGSLSVLFTPWGEALIRRRYQQALVRLSRLPQLRKVAIQTNLSARLDWAGQCDLSRVALWATYHPEQTSRERFLKRCREASRRGLRYSVGVVGKREYAAEIEALRTELPPQTYLWINAYKDQPGYTDTELARRFTAVDRLFPVNLRDYSSRGQPCLTGERVISVDGAGEIRRCHFVAERLGNLYQPGWEAQLRPRPCSRQVCDCHIGYVHMPQLGLERVYGEGLLERIPQAESGAAD